MNLRHLADIVVPGGRRFTDVCGALLIRGYRKGNVEVARIYNWKIGGKKENNFRYNAKDMAPVFDRLKKRDLIGIYLGRFEDDVYRVATVKGVNVVFIGKGVVYRGHIPLTILEKVAIAKEVM
ncbi:MAG: hypothetical protein J7K08_05825 [Thermoplasmata archaeon]|nr:hypothetical protein [Thermoplasmata archaeon]